jgi:hypothetical protein
LNEPEETPKKINDNNNMNNNKDNTDITNIWRPLMCHIPLHSTPHHFIQPNLVLHYLVLHWLTLYHLTYLSFSFHIWIAYYITFLYSREMIYLRFKFIRISVKKFERRDHKYQSWKLPYFIGPKSWIQSAHIPGVVSNICMPATGLPELMRVGGTPQILRRWFPPKISDFPTLG